MSRLVLLDSGPLGKFAHPRGDPKNQLCRQRVQSLLVSGDEVRVPGIAVYENRRKLLHLQLQQPAPLRLPRFDAAVASLGLLPITDAVMRVAAEIWGDARHRGVVTAHPQAFDGDVIVAAHARVEASNWDRVDIATMNSGDLSQLHPNIINWDDLN